MLTNEIQNNSTETSSNRASPHSVDANNDSEIRFEPSNLQNIIFMLMLLVPTTQLIYGTIESGELALLLLVLPLALMVCFFAILISINRHPLIINQSGIKYKLWQKRLGTDFISWDDIHSVSDFYMKGICLVLITLYENKIVSYSSKPGKKAYFLKPSNSFGDIAFCTNNIKGNHDKILKTIIDMHYMHKQYSSSF